MDKYIEFLNRFIELRQTYRKHSWGDCPQLPAPFTEDLLCFLTGFKKRVRTKDEPKHSKGNDLIDDLGNEYEVKATVTDSGTTTAKQSQFHQLIWLYFDFEKLTIRIRYISQMQFNQNTIEKSKTSRFTVTLKNFDFEKEIVFGMKNLNMLE